MVAEADAKVFEELDLHLASIKAQDNALVPALNCESYQAIKSKLVNVIGVISALPDWLKPAWAKTLVVALQALMTMLDTICPTP